MASEELHQFLGACHAYADSVEQDMAEVVSKRDSGLLTENEYEQIMARLAAQHEDITAIIERLRARMAGEA